MNGKREWKVAHLNLHGVKCDAPGCGYCDASVKFSADWLDADCPECGAPLLTMADYKLVLRLQRAVFTINLLFGWLGFMFPGKTGQAAAAQVVMDGTGPAYLVTRLDPAS